jgi:hypothetical protein
MIAGGLMLGLVFLAAACGGGSDTHSDVARIEAADLVNQCSTWLTEHTVDPVKGGNMVAVSCQDRALSHLTGSLWRVRLALDHGHAGHFCQTFDAARYSPGSRSGQSERVFC